MKTALIVGGAAFAVYWLFLRNQPAAQPAAQGLSVAPSFNAYPGFLAPSLSPPPTIFTPGVNADAVTPPANAPTAQLAPASPIFGGAASSVTSIAGRLGSVLVPGSTVGTGTAPSAVQGNLFSNAVQVQQQSHWSTLQ